MARLDRNSGRATKWAMAGLLVALVAAVGCDSRYSPWFDNSDRYDDDDDDDWWDDPCGGMSSSSTSGMGSAGDPELSDDAARAIAEADIVKVVGQRLYALSRTAGLSVVDVSSGGLSLLGQRDIGGIPAEMYVVDGRVYAMSDEATSHYTILSVIDVSEAPTITMVGSQHIQGHLSDSRLVGDVLYLVTAEDHDCSTCPAEPTTFIHSIGVGGSGGPAMLDQLTYEQPDVGDQGFRRSVMATDSRMYVAGIEWDGTSNAGHSTIQVVDISNPDGSLEQGAAVEAAGQILNRWQMDELDGVLRVISQPGVWSSEEVPVVQTYTVESSQVVTPLGSLAIELPVPESLRSVRFDGTRAYAITAQAPEPYDPTPGAELDPPPPPVDSCGHGCDPLFVIDLSNPATPQQMGSLEMPGWVFHMEPRGEHLFALGFESTYPLGALSVSMFDVDDGNNPKMIERVTFGGDWTGLAEDQSRIHKAFSVLDDQGLILVPYGWWDLEIWMDCWDDPCGGGCWEEGEWVQRGAVKVLSFDSFSMTDRGDAPMDSWALRALTHEDDLFAVSNEEVRRFDISGAPAQLDQLWL